MGARGTLVSAGRDLRLSPTGGCRGALAASCRCSCFGIERFDHGCTGKPCGSEPRVWSGPPAAGFFQVTNSQWTAGIEELPMATTLKNAKQQAAAAAKEERARDAALAMQEYEAEKLAIGIKTARLRALRLGKEAESNKRTKRKNPETIPPVL